MNTEFADRIATHAPRFTPGVAHSLLLTGATGFLGGSVAAHLIADGQNEALLFLVRARTPAQGL